MVSHSNGGLSGDILNKRPLEKGYVPNWKPRKVSAVRDFPPGCGLNALAMYSEPVNGCNQAIVIKSEIANAAGTSSVSSHKMAGLMKADGVSRELPKFFELDGIKDSGMVTVVGYSRVKIPNIEVECKSHEAVDNSTAEKLAESLDAVVGKVATIVMDGFSNVVEELKMESGPLEVELNEVGSESDGAVSDPVEVDIAESLDAVVGSMTTIAMDSSGDGSEELLIETRPLGVGLWTELQNDTFKKEPEDGSQTTVNELNELGHLKLVLNSIVKEKPLTDVGVSVDGVALSGHSQSSSSTKGLNATSRLQLGTSPRPMDKYRRRRVSAARDFPPFCGSNIPQPTKEEQQKLISRNVYQVEVETELVMLRNGSDRGAPREMLMRSECLDWEEKIDVKTGRSEKLNCSSGRVLSGETLIGDAKTSDFRQKTLATMKDEFTSSEEFGVGVKESKIEKPGEKLALSGSWKMANVVLDNSDKDTRGPVKKNICVHPLDRNDKMRHSHGDCSEDEVHWEVVHGLMAAPYCPWRKRKGDLVSSNIGTREGKMRKQNLSWQEEYVGFTSKNNLRAGCSGPSIEKAAPVSYDADGILGLSIYMGERHGASDKCRPMTTLISIFKAMSDKSDKDTEGSAGKEVVVYSPGRSDKMRHSHGVFSSVDRKVAHGDMADPYDTWRKEKAMSDKSDKDTEGPAGKEVVVYSPGRSDKIRHSRGIFSSVDRKVSHGDMADPYDTRRKEKVVFKDSDDGTSGGKLRKQKFSWRDKVKIVAKKSNPKAKFSGKPYVKQNVPVSSDADGSSHALMLTDKEGFGSEVGVPENSLDNQKLHDFDISLPPFGPKRSGHGDARNRVRETLRLFHAICRKLLQEEESTPMPEEGRKSRHPRRGRVDLLATKIIKDKGKEVNTGKILGAVPGVEVGDEFQYRVELAVVGIHRLYQNGIDSIKLNGNMPVAISIVASGAYGDDNMENSDVLIYSGQGGNVVEKDKEPEDQKLEKGNLALRNSISANTPVRVVRGWKVKGANSFDSKSKIVTIYVYDGLYTVKNYWTETGSHGKLVFMFELWRNPGQPDLAWKELKKTSKSKTRPGVCITDISGGKEPFPICAVNIFNDEKPPPFNYISRMMYPDWYHPISPEGCDCTGRCSDSHKCLCAVKNGGEIPYNHNGAIVEVKPLVYECGPSCKCPPSCYNRVSQRGIKFQLEIFKTETRGWGVRSLNSIPSGSFICEYSGELLEDKEAEQRIDNDEYLFDIGQNYSDSALKPEQQANLIEFCEGCYTIDAALYGNVGRFINHSCSPNLYAQNVIYDNDVKKMPHVMLFAAENIPPLQELTYHYNYKVGQVYDSNGHIKIKRCYCGTAECRGRMY